MSTAADPRYQKRWRVDRALGRPRTIDVGPTRVHIHELLAARMSVRGIADVAGISPAVVSRIDAGHQRRVTVRVAAAIAAVNPDAMYARPHGPGFVLNVGARRRIKALLALGWRHADITAAMGTGTSSALVLHQIGGWITRDTHDAVTRAYDTLAMTPGPSMRTRDRARKAGYLPPLAWDDEDLDDPNADDPAGYRAGECAEHGCEDTDVFARGLCTTHYHRQIREPDAKPNIDASDLDDLSHLLRAGESPERAAARVGYDLDSLTNAADRFGRGDIQHLLTEAAS